MLVEQSYMAEGEWSSLWYVCAPPKTSEMREMKRQKVYFKVQLMVRQ
jgi:hypothetical protein